ncbi:hypothetical protein KY366_04670 [Candidatus Woesearchaeota archaeon]|nr:hypothetical protein [Candidatus Woesearchaeota archaeon]
MVAFKIKMELDAQPDVGYSGGNSSIDEIINISSNVPDSTSPVRPVNNLDSQEHEKKEHENNIAYIVTSYFLDKNKLPSDNLTKLFNYKKGFNPRGCNKDTNKNTPAYDAGNTLQSDLLCLNRQKSPESKISYMAEFLQLQGKSGNLYLMIVETERGLQLEDESKFALSVILDVDGKDYQIFNDFYRTKRRNALVFPELFRMKIFDNFSSDYFDNLTPKKMRELVKGIELPDKTYLIPCNEDKVPSKPYKPVQPKAPA